MKYFTKEVKIGITAIVAVALLFCGINFLKGVNLFSKSNLYYVEFPNIAGLVVSNAVYADGYAVGIVREINYNYENSGHVVVGVEVDEEMIIPKGTTAELESEILGGVKMNLILARNPLKHLSPGDTISGDMHKGVLNQAEALVPQVEQMMPKLDSILTSLNSLLADPALAQTLHNAKDITANLKKSTESLNTMLDNDVPKLMGKMNRIGSNLETLSGNMKGIDVEGTMAKVDKTLSNVENMTSTLNKKLNSRDNTLGLMLNDRSIYDNLNHTVNSADSLMIDLKANPKRYVHFSVFGKK